MASSPLTLKLSPESRRALKELEQSSKREIAFSRLLRVFQRNGRLAAASISRRMQQGEPLQARTGGSGLAGAITHDASLIEGRPGVSVGIFQGTILQYAGVQEFGTQGEDPSSPYPTIVPKKAKALAMPVGKALTEGGVARYQSPTQFPGELTFAPYKNGESAIGGLYPEKDLAKERQAAKREKRKPTLRNVEAAFVLLKKVDLKPRRFLRSGMLQQLPVLTDEIGDELVRLVGGAP